MLLMATLAYYDRLYYILLYTNTRVTLSLYLSISVPFFPSRYAIHFLILKKELAFHKKQKLKSNAS